MRIKLFFVLLVLQFSYLFSQELMKFEENGKFGLKDKSGNIIFKPDYIYISEFRENKAKIVKNTDSVGIIDNLGKILIPIEYEFLNVLDSTEYLFGKRDKYFGEYKVGVLSEKGNIKIPMKYDFIQKINGYIVTLNKDSIVGEMDGSDIREVTTYYGFYDINGKLILEPKFEYISQINDNLIKVSNDNQYALYHVNGNLIFDFSDNYYYRSKENRVKFKRNKKLGFLDGNGKIVIEPIYDFAFNFRLGMSVVSLDDKCGAIKYNGEILHEIKFECKKFMDELEAKYGDLDFESPEL